MAKMSKEAKAGLKQGFGELGTASGHIAQGTGRAAVRQVRKHPAVASLIGGYTLGAYSASSMRNSNPQFYEHSANKGRSDDRHPGAYY